MIKSTKSCAIRGRSDGNWFETEHRQKLEIGNEMTANSITHVTKDSLIIQTMEQEQSNFNLPIELQGKRFRIRKLTPRECFRLMGVDDDDIDKIQAAGVSNSAQYKMSGNSIVVDVLYHIFRKMFIETEQDKVKGQQLTLF